MTLEEAYTYLVHCGYTYKQVVKPRTVVTVHFQLEVDVPSENPRKIELLGCDPPKNQQYENKDKSPFC